jgi:hypothetical protein
MPVKQNGGVPFSTLVVTETLLGQSNQERAF